MLWVYFFEVSDLYSSELCCKQQYNVMLISTTRRGMPAVAVADHCIEMLFWPKPKVSAPPSSLA